MRLHGIYALLLFVLVPRFATGATLACADVHEADRTKLAGYVQKKYNLPESAQIDVKDLSFIEDSCYRKLQFTWDGGKRQFRIELVASPDLRFLTRELLDSRVDPLAESRRKARNRRQAR